VSPPPAFDDLDPRTPVIAGVGTATQAFDEPGEGDDAATLMTNAAQRAGADSGTSAILAAVQQVAVPAGTWAYPDPGRIIAERIDAADARTVLVQVGIPQQSLFDDAYHAIREGTIDVALVVGGEAARRAAVARRAGVELQEFEQGDVAPDELQLPKTEIITRPEIEGGIASAMAPFALIDSALRFAEGKTIDEQRDEIARLYAGFNAVAATFPDAAFPEPRNEAFLREPSAANRPFSFPYNKWHCAQMNVDQAAAILICSANAARRFAVDPARVVYPVVALESSLFVPVSRRRQMHRWPAMAVLGAAAEAHLGFPLTEIESVEIYSCFPAAIRVQQRALGLPVDGIPTITGGEAFAGGPWNNFVLQTTAAMVDRIRDRGEPYGLVTALSGLMNKPGLAVYATEPPAEPALVADLVDDATRATETVDVVSGYEGPAVIAACTAAYDGLEPVRCTVIADTPTGDRCIATAHDPEVAYAATTVELVGRTIAVDGNQFTL
jgi:acetyl-CoA C-acetyltransferase